MNPSTPHTPTASQHAYPGDCSGGTGDAHGTENRDKHEAGSLCHPSGTTSAAPPDSFLLPSNDESCDPYALYAPRGWTARCGLWGIVEQAVDYSRLSIGAQNLWESTTWDAPAPTIDYVPLSFLHGEQSAQLLQVLPGRALSDRQNNAPTAGQLLHACAEHREQIYLSGYAIGPHRSDERISIEALWTDHPALEEFLVMPSHRAGCQCHAVWERTQDIFSLSTGSSPDEIHRMVHPSDPQREGWWMWWD